MQRCSEAQEVSSFSFRGGSFDYVVLSTTAQEDEDIRKAQSFNRDRLRGWMKCVASYNDKKCIVAERREWWPQGAKATAGAVRVFTTFNGDDTDTDADEQKVAKMAEMKDLWRAAFGRLLREIAGQPQGSLCYLVFEGDDLRDLAEAWGPRYACVHGYTLIECDMPYHSNATVLLPYFQ